MESSSSSSSSSRMAPRGAASSVSVGNVRGTFEELSRTGGRGFNMGNSASMNAAAGAGSSDTFELGDGPAVTADSPALVTARGKDTERLRRQPQKDSSFGGASMDDDDEAHSLSKKRSDKNSREQMRYRKILYLIDNIREKLESVGVLSVSYRIMLSRCASDVIFPLFSGQGIKNRGNFGCWSLHQSNEATVRKLY